MLLHKLTPLTEDKWYYSKTYNTACKLIGYEVSFGQKSCLVWLSDRDVILRVLEEDLVEYKANENPAIENYKNQYVITAAKIAHIIEGGIESFGEATLLSPMSSNVIPLPHQIEALTKSLSDDRIRYLLADEVGLGKTIEAGLILKELKLRGLVKRTLIVSPKSLIEQWISEMKHRFSEDFRFYSSSAIQTLHDLLHQFQSGEDTTSHWKQFNQVIVTQDSIKPLSKRKGWTRSVVERYNQMRFESMVTAGWDLIIVDEAHRLGGGNEYVSRHKLGVGLAKAAPYLLLLSATPHQGKSDAFRRIMQLLDEKAFAGDTKISQEIVSPYVIRTEKRVAIDQEGKPLFKERNTETIQVAWDPFKHMYQIELYNKISEYVVKEYNRALTDHKIAVGFLLVLLQRLVTSSTNAILATLNRRMKVYSNIVSEYKEEYSQLEEEFDSIEFKDMTAQEQLQSLLKGKIKMFDNEMEIMQDIINTAQSAITASTDVKAEELLKQINELQANDPSTNFKVLIFTEFIATQEMLRDYLSLHHFEVVCLNGSLSLEERIEVQDAFKNDAQIMISTDAGGEGLNLQFCHIVFNYDIPWNPMRLEQRIGRVDRIGQTHVVKAFNLSLRDTVEDRVHRIIEQKLSIILKEFGIDKTSDIWDSSLSSDFFENLYLDALLHPDFKDEEVEKRLLELRNQMKENQDTSPLKDLNNIPSKQSTDNLQHYPLSDWIQSMCQSYILANGGSVDKKSSGLDLTWPDGSLSKNAVFQRNEKSSYQNATFLDLENPKVKGILYHLPYMSEEPIACISIPTLQEIPNGFWGLFEISIQAGKDSQAELLHLPLKRRSFLPVFVTDQQQYFQTTAIRIWDECLSRPIQITTHYSLGLSRKGYDYLKDGVEKFGRSIYDSLVSTHQKAIQRETRRGKNYFEKRMEAIDLIGLPEVKSYRRKKMIREENNWWEALSNAQLCVPNWHLIAAFRILGKANG